jgi:dTDP-4-dehydrorhamnose reductase
MSRLFIAGQEGMVGQAIYKLIKKNNFNIVDCKRKNLDLKSCGLIREIMIKYINLC